MKQKIIIWLGWGVSLVLLYFAFRGLDWFSVMAAFSKISPFTPILMMGLYLLGFLVRAWRWKLLLPTRISLGDSFKAVILGYAANNILPARLGEFVRAEAVARKCEISRSVALASILVERVFDGLILTGLLYLGIKGDTIPQWASSVGFLGISIFGGALTVISVLAFTRSFWESKVEALPSSKLRDIFQKFVTGLTLVWRTPFTPITMLGLTLGVWLIEGLMFEIAIQAFNFNVPSTAGLFVMGVVNLGILIPSAPGYLGAFQYFGSLSLSAWKVPQSAALACIVLIHACQYLPVTLLGLSFIPYFGFTSLNKLKKEIK